MKYMGSKAKITKFIVPIIQQKIEESGSRTYLEPFAGGCNVIDKVNAKYRVASDKNEYLIALFKYLQVGGELPEKVTREEYNAVREDYNAAGGKFPQWYIGAVGFLASYNGRFFDGGYAGYGKDKGRVRDYYQESRNNILQQMQQGGVFGIDFRSGDYREYAPEGCVIYCDPPYEGTKRYGNARQFDYSEFWQLMREWSRNNIVLVSELNAPDDFITIWEKEVDRSMKAKEHFRATEKLFMWGGGDMPNTAETIENDAYLNSCKCPICGKKHFRGSEERTFYCSECGTRLHQRAFTEKEVKDAIFEKEMDEYEDL